MHGQIQRVVWGLPDWWVKLLRTRLPKRGHLLVFRQNWTKPYLEVWVCLVLSALNLCFVSIIVSPSVWCGVRNQHRSNCFQFWDFGFYSDYVCLCVPLSAFDWLSFHMSVCLCIMSCACSVDWAITGSASILVCPGWSQSGRGHIVAATNLMSLTTSAVMLCRNCGR